MSMLLISEVDRPILIFSWQRKMATAIFIYFFFMRQSFTQALDIICAVVHQEAQYMLNRL